ncbi:hypothetical protein AHAS_Ahas14G0196800 [Arachis hypogaea]
MIFTCRLACVVEDSGHKEEGIRKWAQREEALEGGSPWLDKRGLPPSKAARLFAHFLIPSSLCLIPSTSLQTLFFVRSYIPSSSIAMSSPTESGSTPAEPISMWKLVLVASIVVRILLVNAVQIA